MSIAAIAAGGLALACGFLFWRLQVANRKLGAERAAHASLRKRILQTSELSRERIRDLTGLDPQRLRIDEDGGIWAE